MGVPGVIFDIDDTELQQRLDGLLAHFGDFRPVMEDIGELGVVSIAQNFEEGGRPNRWKEWSPATIEKRRVNGPWPGMILKETGAMSDIHSDVGEKSVTWSAGNVEYAAIQHFGGNTGRGGATVIPARPYMLLQEEDETEIKGLLLEFIMEE